MAVVMYCFVDHSLHTVNCQKALYADLHMVILGEVEVEHPIANHLSLAFAITDGQ